MITKYEFEVLYLAYNNDFKNQRHAADTLGYSLGTINNTVADLVDKGLIDKNNAITINGEKALEPFAVENAVIMAAGMSSRFAPLSFEKPKGLLNVKGEILIERQIRQLQEKGINDITVVLGYMKEKFFYLEQKYGVNLVVNADYYRYNNTSTLMKVLKKLGNTYICSSDNYFAINVFNSHEYKAVYPVQKHSVSEDGEYYASFNKQKLITNVTIGKGEYCMVGHVYYDREFSKGFATLLTKEFEKLETKTKLWEKVYVEHLDQFTMYAREYSPLDILEFDSLAELQEFDNYYINNTDSKILHNIMDVLECEVQDIKDIVAIKDGLTNTSFKFTVRDKNYIYRHPGVGTDSYINRKAEAFAQRVAKEQELDDSFIFMDEEEGWKLSYFIDDAHTLDYHNDEEVTIALSRIKALHDLKLPGDFEFDIWAKTHDFIDAISERGRDDFQDFDDLLEKMTRVYKLTEADKFDKILCHCDFYDPNILFKNSKMYLIDWEYAGVDDPGVDIGTFIACSDYSMEEAFDILEKYEGRPMSKERLQHFIAYVAIASYYWFIWAIFQESNGALVGEYLYIWYRYSYKYADKALELYGE
ncbi:phosphotransferase [Erysipelothrix sp. HDW6C]|uniref:phosphotransferase n=1 Tax=Erysipelothrix sp. HDW6C TaxID=2714930 RepID=UPI00140C7656|nr:phosphotransferase [Erysipelothrix sp. HDW6C]QIK70048.1 phosphotransferase [Erysipelothrix sp. HDW6C]